jgi:para-nitrobenzyl esterase
MRSLWEAAMKKFLSIVLIVLVLGSIGYFAKNYFYKPAPVKIVADPDAKRPTTGGEIVGYKEDNATHAWLGIPFAKPPVGELRWKAPRPPEPWKDTRESLDVCSVCTQYGGPLGSVEKKFYDQPVGSEDCLYLNVYAPAYKPANIPKDEKRLPVMVWLHGGGNSIGYGGYYRGKNLAEKYNLIIVTINYRLGPMGWFSHPALKNDALSPEDQSGNYGTLDIIAALSWVKDNISNFGGNPGNVTVFGESAGAVDTLSMMLSPKAKGLFHKAISQSGMARIVSMENAENYTDDANAKGHPFSSREVVNRLLIADGLAANRDAAKEYQNRMNKDEIAAFLHKKNNFDILRAYRPGPFGMISFPALFQDGTVLPKADPLTLFKDANQYNPVPLIIGTNRDEFKIFMAQDPEFVKRYLGVIARFKDPVFYQLFAKYRSDVWKAIGVDAIAESIAESNGGKVYAYRFDWDEEPFILGMDMSKLVGAAHGMEIPFVFNSFDRSLGLMKVLFTKKNYPERQTLSDSMSSYWAEFAYSGSPGKGKNQTEFEWKPWDNRSLDADKFIVFDTKQSGGVRMSRDIVGIIDLKTRLLSDKSFPEQKQHCQTYVGLFDGTPLWSDEEYAKLGKQGCADFPKESFRRNF